MVRNYVKKTTPHYAKEMLPEALADIKLGRFFVYRASKHYKIAKNTISERILLETTSNASDCNATDVNHKCIHFIACLQGHFNATFPIKKVHYVKSSWITQEAKMACQKVKDLYNLKKKYPQLGLQYLKSKKSHHNYINICPLKTTF